MQIYSFSPFGYEGALVNVEVDLRRGIPAVDVVGLADGAVKESRERMRSAIRNSGYDFPPERVLISLSPADVRKEGAGFDLAIALAVLAERKKNKAKEEAWAEDKTTESLAKDAAEAVEGDADCVKDTCSAKRSDDCEADEGANYVTDGENWKPEIDSEIKLGCIDKDAVLVMGELELNGKVRPVRGIEAAVSTAVEAGISMCIVPSANTEEARGVKGMKVFGAENLTDAFEALYSKNAFTSGIESSFEKQTAGLPEGSVNINGVFFGPVEAGYEFSEIHGQKFLIRGLQIAAAGGHNVLAFGPPGCGKTLALQRFPALMPLLTLEESQPVTRIHSLSGLLQPGRPVLRNAPFRMPHQTASIEGMCGGGIHLSPGEISLAHNGILFLDEAAEFRSSVLQMLRVPLESGTITLSRAGRSSVFPARFQLLMATNPCPCGNYGSSEKICLCSAHSVEQYWRKFSGPLLDRIEIRVHVDTKNGGQSEYSKEDNLSSAELRKDIAKAILIQRKRQGKKNAFLTPAEISEYCVCSDEARAILDAATEHYDFSPRGIAGCLRLSRTIADMEGIEKINGKCMEEAVLYRKTEGGI